MFVEHSLLEEHRILMDKKLVCPQAFADVELESWIDTGKFLTLFIFSCSNKHMANLTALTNELNV